MDGETFNVDSCKQCFDRPKQQFKLESSGCKRWFHVFISDNNIVLASKNNNILKQNNNK